MWDCPVCKPPVTQFDSRHLARPGPPATALPRVLFTQLPGSTPPTGMDECFFFHSLVVRPPYSSIFCKFWLFFVFTFVVALLLVVSGGTVCLPMPLSWSEVYILILERVEAGSERDRDIDLFASSMCPDLGLNPQHFGIQDDAITNWDTEPGQALFLEK